MTNENWKYNATLVKTNMNIEVILFFKKELFTGVQLFTQLEMNREDHVTTRPDEI